MCRLQFTLHVCHEASIKRRRINAPLLDFVYHFESASALLGKNDPVPYQVPAKCEIYM